MPFLYIVYALLVSLFWGTNFVAVRIAEHSIPPYLLLTLRFILVALMLLPFYPKRTLPLKFLLQMSFIFGTLSFALVFGAMYYGVDVPTTVITSQLGVPFSCLLSAMFFNDRLGPWRSFGLMIAFLGMTMVAGTPNVVEHFFPFLMVMGSAFFWAVSNVLMKRQGNINVLEMLAWVSLFTVPQMALLSFVVEDNQFQMLAAAPMEAYAAVGYTALFSTVISYGLWYYLLRHHEVSSVAPFSLLVPFFGIAADMLYFPDVDPIHPRIIWGGVMTIIGVAIIVVRKPKLAIFGKIRKSFES